MLGLGVGTRPEFKSLLSYVVHRVAIFVSQSNLLYRLCHPDSLQEGSCEKVKK